jgi:tripeptide aminopeptidase
MKNVVDLFLQLVRIPSPLYKVGEIQKYLKALFTDLFPMADIWQDTAGNDHSDYEAGNLLINIPASVGYEHYSILAVEAHVDTVDVRGEIKPIIKDQVISSDGSTILGADDKAGIAAICAAAGIIKDFSHGPIQILFTVGEEMSMYGVKALDFSKIKAKEILCVDGFSPKDLITACAGKIKYQAKFMGKGGHGAFPEKGVNAIEIAARVISSCMRLGLTGRMENHIIHNISEIQSHEGKSEFPSTNVIPAETIVSGELRGLS